eukprot:TRINITY_DN1445_c0_g1_i1.p1 TRINITY_DN1445_c0_g1~~TRINITY_DN1445_c0_g1_i1.p1  ORF type:complete len:1712 (+),score=871.44 TRINITY_DN1445_c0_g1_i1:90-5225(+)
MDGPVVCKLVTNLTQVDGGLNAASLRPTNITMESDRYVCVRDVSKDASGQDQNSIVIVDLMHPSKISTRHRMLPTDAAIMNPVSKVLALRNGQDIQIFNLDMKARMKSTKMAEPVLFMKWITPVQIALITGSSVYHWSMEGEAEPVLMFQRKERECQVLNYRTDADCQWLLLIGITPDATRRGVIELFSVDKGVTKTIDGHAVCFCEFKAPGQMQSINLMCISNGTGPNPSCFIAEVPRPGQNVSGSFNKVTVPIPVHEAGDFPVGMHANNNQGLIYVVFRSGWVNVLDVQTGTMVHQEKINGSPESVAVFLSTQHEETGGVLTVNIKGEVRLAHINEATIVQWVTQKLGNQALAVRIATMANLGGADELFTGRFNMLIQSNQIDAAVKLCCEAPKQMLRTPEVLQRFQSMTVAGTGQTAATVYFKYMMEHSKLNAFESVELAKVMLTKQQGIDFVKKYLEDKKLEESEELGDIVAPIDHQLALQIYFRGKAHWKILNVLLQQKDWKNILDYVKREKDLNLNPFELLEKVFAQNNPEGASELAQALNQDPSMASQLDHNRILEMFIQRNAIRPATAYLLEVLKDNLPEHGALQTRLLEINLMYSPAQVADKILEQFKLSYYDALKVAQLCERAQLYQRALENYNKYQRETDYQESTLADIKRVIVNTHLMNQEWLVDFFQHLSKDDAITCLNELMSNNVSQNYKLCVQVAIKNYEVLGTQALIDLFLSFKHFESLYYFLWSIIKPKQSGQPGCTDPEVHFRYIEAAANVGQMAEVERMTRESEHYPAEKTKNFLKEKRLQDLWPFINVCDKHNFMDEMVRFLYDTKNLAYIDMYIQKKAPMKTPLVVGSLLDVGCQEDYIKKLVVSVGSMAPIEELVEEVEKRNRLRMLQDWLEGRLHTSQDKGLYNALAKIYVDTNQNAKHFLTENVGKYDPETVGKYCENRDPNLAVLAYEHGGCDKQLIEVTARNGMFKQQARYLVARMDPELWAFVLETEEQEPYRKSLIDAVVATALPEAKKAEEVSVTVKAFMQANLPEYLTTLLEKIVLHADDKSEFKNNRYLQNLLILTAINSSSPKVMDYVQRLDNYDTKTIAEIASKAGLYEEAFTIYKKEGLSAEATEVLLQNLQNIERAREFAEKANLPAVWAKVGVAELQKGDVALAITSFIKADDASHAQAVINAVKQSGSKDAYVNLVKFLNMARSGTKQKNENIDTELCYAYCITNRINDLEDFLKDSNLAKVGDVGQRCYQEELYDAAKLCFSTVSNFPFLAKTHMKLGQFQLAIDAAGRTNSVETWKEVCYACVDAEEFRLAATAAQHVIVVADELDGLIHFFESRGRVEELIGLLKQGLTSDRAHVGMFTELGILYAKYKHEKLMEHIKLWKNRLNAHKLVTVCEQYHHWAEIRYVHCQNEEWDRACSVMMDHSVLSWDHEIFKDSISKVSSLELCYNGVGFYLEEHPDLVNDLLITIIKRVDPERVVTEVTHKGKTNNKCYMPVIRPYLESVQEGNHKKVNAALNRMYIEEEDYESLRKSLEQHDAVDQLDLAQELDEHDLLEMRRLGAWLYKKNGKYAQAIELSKRDKLYQDAMATATESKDKKLVEGLMRFFTDNDLKECFSACLFTCYDYIQPDVALELAWRHKAYDFAMPYIIQVLREYIDKIDDVSSQLKDAKEQAEKHVASTQPMHSTTQAPLMISQQPSMPYAGGYSQQPGYQY